jgi:murein DD-endopeptidase MepM/ murein hydrolase activator NlpD
VRGTVKRAGLGLLVKLVGWPVMLFGAVAMVLMLGLASLMLFLGAGAAEAKDQHDTQAAATTAGSTCQVNAAEGDGEGGARVEVPEAFKQPVKDAAEVSGLPEEIVAAQINQESGFSTSASSPVGAQGPAQFMPATWETYGEGGDVNDPEDAMAGYGRYMKHLLEVSKPKADKNEGGPDAARLAVASYNAGEAAPGLEDGEIPPYEETQNYVKTIFDGAQEDYSVECKQVASGSDVSEVELGDGEWAKPLPGGQHTSGYGARNVMPGCAPGDYSISNGCHANFHLGADIATPGAGKAPGGTVVSPTKAEVVCVPDFDGMVQVKVTNGDDSELLLNFIHLAERNVKVGDELERGDPIGVEGNVGQFDMSTHLHLEAMKPGTPACTLPWERDDKGDLYNVDPEPILKEKGAL